MNEFYPLANLRDIHLPEPVSWWPPAPGWWIVFLLVLVGIFLAGVAWRKYLRQTGYRKAALRELEEVAARRVPDQAVLEAVAALLRRVAIQAYGREKVAHLTGEAWLTFLDRTGGTDKFGRGAAKVLGTELYNPVLKADMDEVMKAVRNWIGGHRK